MKRYEEGFTLVELIVVLLVTAIMVKFAFSHYTSTTVFSLNSITEQLRRDIRYTQALAMSLNASYTITLVAGSYSISPTPATGAVSVTMPSGITLTPTTITFDAMGNPGAAAKSISVAASGVATNTVTVAAETGFVT